MFISPAFAQAAAPAGGSGFDIASILPLILIFFVFYFLMIRPQQKKMKEHKALIEGLRRGDSVVTGGGIMGKVTKVNEDGTAEIEIAENVRIKVLKGTVTEVRNRSEPAPGGTPGATPPAQKPGGLLGNLFGKK
jgi:preprotein translocase subunit YajC